jgi:3D (Asp-Asp-Asp) domain-containing protein
MDSCYLVFYENEHLRNVSNYLTTREVIQFVAAVDPDLVQIRSILYVKEDGTAKRMTLAIDKGMLVLIEDPTVR